MLRYSILFIHVCTVVHAHNYTQDKIFQPRLFPSEKILTRIQFWPVTYTLHIKDTFLFFSVKEGIKFKNVWKQSEAYLTQPKKQNKKNILLISGLLAFRPSDFLIFLNYFSLNIKSLFVATEVCKFITILFFWSDFTWTMK